MNLNEKIKKLLSDNRRKELIMYLFFGGLTTLVSIVIYAFCTRVLDIDIVTSNVISWVISVTFAYITNRTWVFASKKHGLKPITLEAISFYLSRLFSGLVETVLLYIFADKLGLYDLAVKVAATVIVIILNYILSKIIVFRKKT